MSVPRTLPTALPPLSLAGATLLLAACAGPGGPDASGRTAVTPPTSGIAPERVATHAFDDERFTGDVERLASEAAEAYRRGDLDRAEVLFETLRRHDPNDRRAVYNIAMLDLQRAYEGLGHYLTLETRAAERGRAARLLERLGELR